LSLTKLKSKKWTTVMSDGLQPFCTVLGLTNTQWLLWLGPFLFMPKLLFPYHLATTCHTQKYSSSQGQKYLVACNLGVQYKTLSYILQWYLIQLYL